MLEFRDPYFDPERWQGRKKHRMINQTYVLAALSPLNRDELVELRDYIETLLESIPEEVDELPADSSNDSEFEDVEEDDTPSFTITEDDVEEVELPPGTELPKINVDEIS